MWKSLPENMVLAIGLDGFKRGWAISWRFLFHLVISEQGSKVVENFGKEEEAVIAVLSEMPDQGIWRPLAFSGYPLLYSVCRNELEG